MSQKSTIEITFSRDAVNGEVIEFNRVNDFANTIAINSTFVDSRVRNGQIEIQPNTGTDGEAEAMAFVKYFEIDHNVAGLMDVSRDLNVVTIEIDLAWEFQDFSSDAGATSDITARIPEDFTLVSATLQIHPTEPCDKVDVEINTTQLADSYHINDSNEKIPVTTNPFTVTVDRTLATKIWVNKEFKTSIDVSEVQWEEPHIYIRKVFQGQGIHFGIQQNPLVGATVTIYVNFAGQLAQRPLPVVLEYSLDNVNFQSSNVFTGQVAGDYTIYIRDGLGCTVSKNFTVPEGVVGLDPFFKIAKINSLSFSKNEVWDGLQDGIFKNFNNTISSTQMQTTIHDEVLIFTDEDTIKIQFKSNYDYHDVKIQNCKGDNLGTVITVEKRSNNLNLFESLDAKMFSYAPGVTAVFFISGNIYDVAGVDIGDYELNGNMPDYAYSGNQVEIVGHGVHEIQDVIYDKDIGKKVILFAFESNTTVPFDVVTKAYYNILPYDIFEFEIDFGAIIIQGTTDDRIRCKIQATDDLYDEVNYYSEYVTIYEHNLLSLNNYIGIAYQNQNDRDIFYRYGISHFLRAEILQINAIIDDESEIVKGDAETYLTESSLSEGIRVSFAEVTYRVMMKICLALSSENLFVNGIGYVKQDNIEVNAVENTNLYLITVNLLETGEDFNTFTQINVGNDEDYKTIYIPGLTDTGGGTLLKI